MTSLRPLPLVCLVLGGCLGPPPPLSQDDDESTGAEPETTGPQPGTLGQTTDPSDSGDDPGAQSDTGTDDGDGTTAGDESSTGEEPPSACCNAECWEACSGPECEPVQLGGPSGTSAFGVTVVGEFIVWSTGWGSSLEVSGPEPGTAHQLAAVISNAHVSQLASDDTHVYFLDSQGSHVKRATVPQGAVDLVANVPGVEPQAGLGAIVLDDEYAYFAMQTTGGVWRAAKDLSQPVAELVYEAATPKAVAVDDTHVFWGAEEGGTQHVFRLALDDIGNAAVMPALVYDGVDITALAADETGLYIGDNGAVVRVNPLGTNQGIMDLAIDQGVVQGIALDDVHAYWTSFVHDWVGRARKDGVGVFEVLASTAGPVGVAISCDAVYWASGTDQALYGRPK